jgi:hypothetical protein
MKSFPLLPALLLAAPLLHANHRSIEDASGTVAPLTFSVAISETIGGTLLTDAKKAAAEAKGATYPSLITYNTTYLPDVPVSAVMNPFWWDATKGNNYVERVTTKAAGTPSPVVTADGTYAIAATRYTNATLLADLAASGRIPSIEGYRVVVVNFDLPEEVHYYNGTYTTHVNGRLYFFAEKGATDPAPVFLGAEYDEIYLYKKVIGFRRSTTIKSGKYSDTFTGDPAGGGFVYKLASQSFTGRTAADITFYRPTPGDNLYQIRLGGIFSWTQRYDAKKEVITGGGFSGSGLDGPAEQVFVVRTTYGTGASTEETEAPETDAPHSNNHGYAYDYIPNGGNQGVASGSTKTGVETRYDSMSKYLNAIPVFFPH